ncbi:MAG: hypothetical protein J7L55_02850 [Desulfurococcales archaeon]|nr:hypothetical protein [Desulfurococcales archaeon]
MSRQGLSRTEEVLRELLRKYFSRAEIQLPDDFILREFAFQSFTTKRYVRHLSFQSLASLREYLINETPLNSYYSVALYRDPAASSMEDKGLIGAELLFDIDVDHIPGCDSQELTLPEGKPVHIISGRCIELGKEHQLRLIDFLIKDFGFSEGEITYYFTGNRGFHTVVRPKDTEWLKMISSARRELVDYIKGNQLDLRLLLPSRKVNSADLHLPVKGGWLGRAAALIREGKTLDEIVVDEVVNRFSVEVDEQVTPDLSRLIRIPNTLNGKSGLPVKVFRNESELLEFTYGIHLSPFEGESLVKPLITSKVISILGEKIQLYPDQLILLPLPVGIFLALNGAVHIERIM